MAATVYVTYLSFSSLLFSVRLIAAWSKWIITPGGLVLALINMPLGNIVGLFAKLVTHIDAGTFGRAFTVPEAAGPFGFASISDVVPCR